MRKILVTAISGNVSNGILKILKETDDEVYGCDIYDYPVGMDKVKVCMKSIPAVRVEYIKDILDKCRQYGITHLIPVNETEIQAISDNIERFNQKNIKVLINRRGIIDIFLDKYSTVKCLSDIEGVFVPKSYLYSEFVEDGNQYIVKLKNSCGSKFLKLIKSREELDEFPYEKENYIIQEYLDDGDNEFTVGCFSNGTDISTIIFRRKLEHGYTSFVELVQNDEISSIARKIASAIDLHGYINIQMRKYKESYYIFEINPRISGTVYFRHMLGFRDVIWWLDMLDGVEYQYTPEYKKAIGMRELNEKFLVLERINGNDTF